MAVRLNNHSNIEYIQDLEDSEEEVFRSKEIEIKPRKSNATPKKPTVQWKSFMQKNRGKEVFKKDENIWWFKVTGLTISIFIISILGLYYGLGTDEFQTGHVIPRNEPHHVTYYGVIVSLLILGAFLSPVSYTHLTLPTILLV